MSRTSDALAWMAQDDARSAYAAAKLFGLSASAVSRARRAQRAYAKPRCPACGAIVKKPGTP